MSTDLDKSGQNYQWSKVYLGPSIGWQDVRVMPETIITTGGTHNLQPDAASILVNVASPVTINLPDVTTWMHQPGAEPSPSLTRAITVKDFGGNAEANPITIVPFTGQTIDGGGNKLLNANFQILSFWPLNDLSGWYLQEGAGGGAAGSVGPAGDTGPAGPQGIPGTPGPSGPTEARFDSAPPIWVQMAITEDADSALFASFDTTWTPASLANKVIWLKADTAVYSDAGVTPAIDAATVQQWTDQANGYVFSQATAGNRPTYDADGINGLPTVTISPASAATWLETPALAVTFSTTVATFIVTAYPEDVDDGTGGRIFSMMTDHGGNDYDYSHVPLVYRNTGLELFDSFSGIQLRRAPSPPETAAIFMMVFNGTNETTFLDGVTISTPVLYNATIGDTNGVTMAVGQGLPGHNYSNSRVRIAEILIVADDLTADERSKVTFYNKHKYGFFPWA